MNPVSVEEALWAYDDAEAALDRLELERWQAALEVLEKGALWGEE